VLHVSGPANFSKTNDFFLSEFSARPEVDLGGGEVMGSPREDSLLPTDKQRKKIEKEWHTCV